MCYIDIIWISLMKLSLVVYIGLWSQVCDICDVNATAPRRQYINLTSCLCCSEIGLAEGCSGGWYRGCNRCAVEDTITQSRTKGPCGGEVREPQASHATDTLADEHSQRRIINQLYNTHISVAAHAREARTASELRAGVDCGIESKRSANGRRRQSSY